MLFATVRTNLWSKIDGIIFLAVGFVTNFAIATAAFSFMSSVIRRTRLSNAPRKTPGNVNAS